MKAKRPTWTRFVAVDMASEGLDLGPDALAVRKELAAYTQKTNLAAVWRRLSCEAQAALERAWELEMQGTSLRAARRLGSAPHMALAAGDGEK